MQRYLIIFSYDGSDFAGYQIQPDLRTIQAELERALKKINNNQDTVIHSSGRTDKGVHANFQTAHFDLSVKITESKLKRALNSNMPNDIHVIRAMKVDKNFHARYLVKSKEYIYKINLGEYNPTKRNYVYQCGHSLNIKQMKKAIKYFIGTHDFRSFVSENKDKKNCIRTIYDAKIRRDKKDKNQYEFYFKGTGFLKYQVRNMVGLLIRVGEGKIHPKKVVDILKSCDRTKAGKTAPSEGLYLNKVNY